MLGDDQPAAIQMSWIDMPFAQAQEDVSPRVEWAWTPIGHSAPLEL